MSETKNKKKLILLIVVSAVLLCFLGYNIYWYSFYKPFKHWSDSCEFEENMKSELGIRYAQDNETAQETYNLLVPSYLRTFGQISISQWLKMNEDSQSEYIYSQDMEYAVLLKINKTISEPKTYWVVIIHTKGATKDSDIQEYTIQVDENMNVINSKNYSEIELKYFEECQDTINELYVLLKSFYGEDNINDL